MRYKRAFVVASLSLAFTSSLAAAQTVTYTYDDLGRVVSSSQSGMKTVYTTDSADNRVEAATFNPANEHPPVANNDSVSAVNGVVHTFDPRSNDSDPDGDALTITGVGTPAHGSASFTGTSVSYTPVRGYTGTDSFTYTIADGKGGTASATITASISGLLTTGLIPGESQYSSDGRFRATLQTDGNFVLYYGSSALWAANTSGSGATQTIFQTDGNLVVYNGTTVKWKSNTDGHPSATLTIQTDGNMVIYNGSSAIWATNTCCH